MWRSIWSFSWAKLVLTAGLPEFSSGWATGQQTFNAGKPLQAGRMPYMTGDLAGQFKERGVDWGAGRDCPNISWRGKKPACLRLGECYISRL